MSPEYWKQPNDRIVPGPIDPKTRIRVATWTAISHSARLRVTLKFRHSTSNLFKFLALISQQDKVALFCHPIIFRLRITCQSLSGAAQN